uniref:Glycoside hydrolase family 5 domain-containing protein n=1 Tax=Acrobeloides nanus TaxID=290746 RepID=A0A914DMP2_9BILA
MHKFVLLLLFLHEIYGRTQWTPDQAFAWFNAQKPYIMGTEYMTSSAVNQQEMWQAETFDSVLIDKEMAVGQQLGMTAMRIFLEDSAYSQDPAGFKNRMSTVVGIMSKYGIKPLFVFFTNGAIPNPANGIQPKPIPGVESSDVVGTFANDSRVLGWDMWNEPDDGINLNDLMLLFPKACDWARSMNPIQPYADPGSFEAAILRLQKLGRPIIATEYMARTLDSTFANTLPLGKKYNIGMISWGFVNGKTQFNLDWGSGRYPNIDSPPTVWFQDILRNDRSPYLLEEAQIMKRLNGCPLGYHSAVNNWTCYNGYDTPLSFSDAQTACKNTWSNMVTISNAFENSDLAGKKLSFFNNI